jgi:hypothetical protein
MGGVDDYLDNVKHKIYLRIYEKHFFPNFQKLTNIVALQKRKEQEIKLTQNLYQAMEKKVR